MLLTIAEVVTMRLNMQQLIIYRTVSYLLVLLFI